MKSFKRSIPGYVAMLHPEITIHSDDDDDVMTIDDEDFKRPSIDFGMRNAALPSLGADLLINKSKVSSDVLSISSKGRSDSGSSSYGTDGTDEDMSAAMRYKRAPSISSASESTTDDDASSIPDTVRSHQQAATRLSSERVRAEGELQEKKEILYQMDRLEAKGYRLPKRFNLQSDIEEMRVEFNRIIREKEVDASIRFQRKMMMALVTGVEYLNTRFDPFDIRLNGWSEQVHDNINDYDDIFEELHDKYKGTGKKMAPELRLLMSLSGSAFMFHFTNSMFKQSNVPDVEDVIRSDPHLMKQFQQAAMQKMANEARSKQPGGGGGGGIFGMVSNLFGMQQPSMPSPVPKQQSRPRSVEDIINDVGAGIPVVEPTQRSQSNRYETLSVSDEEITSIIEDTADINGLMGSTKRRGGGRRTAAPLNNNGRRTLQL